MDSFDLFATKPAVFNFKGREKLYSIPGIITTVLISSLVTYICVYKVIAMYTSNRFEISTHKTYDNYSSLENAIDLETHNFQVAIGI